MIVCVCRNLSDRAIDAALDAGARDVADVAKATGATSSCGCCEETIEAMLARRGPCRSAPCEGCPRAALAGRRAAA